MVEPHPPIVADRAWPPPIEIAETAPGGVERTDLDTEEGYYIFTCITSQYYSWDMVEDL